LVFLWHSKSPVFQLNVCLIYTKYWHILITTDFVCVASTWKPRFVIEASRYFNTFCPANYLHRRTISPLMKYLSYALHTYSEASVYTRKQRERSLSNCSAETGRYFCKWIAHKVTNKTSHDYTVSVCVIQVEFLVFINSIRSVAI
jgi:hypothetical protein